MAPRRGCFIAFEGIDGCGKTTQARRIADRIGARLTFEPGDTPLGAELRSLLLHRGDLAISPATEALLMCADRAEHVASVISPTLDAGTHVVTDRYFGSTIAYQGAGRSLPLLSLHHVIDFATSGLEPDLTILIDLDLQTAKRRLSANPDRLEQLDEGFFTRVRHGFIELAATKANSWVVLDGRAPLEEISNQVDAIVAPLIDAR